MMGMGDIFIAGEGRTGASFSCHYDTYVILPLPHVKRALYKIT